MKNLLINQTAEEMTVRDSAAAPIVFFDHVPVFGVQNGILRLSLEAGILVATGVGDEVKVGRVSVAHLRMNEVAARNLITAIEGALAMLKQAAGSEATQAAAGAARHSMN